jgi:glycosyltransferase involved in cell wall biosynthesis
MKEKYKLVFILPNLGAGGAQRVISFVAQNIDKEKFDTTLLITGTKDNKCYATDEVKTIFFDKKKVRHAVFDIIRYLKKNRPDIVVSAQGHLNVVMALISIFFPRIIFIGREVNVLSVLENHLDSRNEESSILTKITYKLFDKIICQSNDMFEDLRTNYSLDSEKLVVINNPISSNFKVKVNHISRREEKFQLITVGRLAKQKGHRRILEVLSKLDFPFHYTLIGDGPEKDTILKTINELGIEDNVTHIPFTKDVHLHLSQSDLFLQGSYVEGFPNSLIESCAVGTPVMAFKALGGIDEIIEEGINGYIALDIDDYIHKTAKILNSLHEWIPEDVSNSVMKKYNAKKVLTSYEKLFQEIVDK